MFEEEHPEVNLIVLKNIQKTAHVALNDLYRILTPYCFQLRNRNFLLKVPY